MEKKTQSLLLGALLGLLWNTGVLAAPATPVAPCVISSSNVSGVTIENCIPVTTSAPLPVTMPAGGGAVVTVAPYAYTPLTPSQFGLAVVASTALTPPAGATLARACVRTAEVETTTDGTTPTTAPRGTAFGVGSCTLLSGAAVIAAFRAISATGTLDVEYYK